MSELQINFTVFALASFLGSQGLRFLGDRALHSFLSPLLTAHGRQMLANVCQDGIGTRAWSRQMWLHLSLTNTPVAGTTCFR